MEKYEIKKLFEYRLASEWAEYIEVFNINFNGVSVFAIADADKDDGLFSDDIRIIGQGSSIPEAFRDAIADNAESTEFQADIINTEYAMFSNGFSKYFNLVDKQLLDIDYKFYNEETLILKHSINDGDENEWIKKIV